MLKLTAIVLCLPLINVLCKNTQLEREILLENLLNSDVYDRQIKPANGNETDSPTTVSINLHIISVSQIDDLKMLYTLDLYFRQSWTDERLKFSSQVIELLTLSDSHLIWVPDIFFVQAHKSYFHDLMEPNTYVTVNQNGTVFRSARVTLILRCPMQFGRFPFDSHICHINIESYQWKAQDIHLQWLDDPVTRTDEILSPLFSFDKYTTSAGLIAVKSGEYSILSLELYFSRQIKYYIVHMFIPCCLIFNVSCLACWLSPRLMTARVLIGLASLFSLAMLSLNFNQDTPQVPYLRSVDIFIGMCMTFIFFTLVETIFVHLSESKQSENAIEEIEAADKDDIDQNEKILPKRNAIKQMKEWLYDNHQTLNDIDAASRVLFPICFLIFLVIYSITCAATAET